jgi:putative ABC transport system ATP-binding protein
VSAFLEARGAGKRFAGGATEVRALAEVSLAVPRGACVVVTGPSGGGKTTLLALLGTLERATEGQVLVEGTDVAEVSEGTRSRLRRRFGFAFPGGPLVPRLPLWENLTLAAVARGGAVAERRAAAQTALARLGLTAKLRARPEELSTGEIARSALARALLGAPEAVFADEPLANLDPASQALVLDALREAHRAGTTLVVASHAVEPFAFASELVRLEGGRRVPTGGPFADERGGP